MLRLLAAKVGSKVWATQVSNGGVVCLLGNTNCKWWHGVLICTAMT